MHTKHMTKIEYLRSYTLGDKGCEDPDSLCQERKLCNGRLMFLSI